MAAKIRSILGCVLGFAVGAVLAGYLLMELGPLVVGEAFRNLGGLYLLCAIPLGAGFGGGLGFHWAKRYPTSFLGVFLPICSAVGFLAYGEYRKMHETAPVDFQLVLKPEKLDWMVGGVAQGHPFEGVVVADGVETPINGTVPAELRFRAVSLRYRIVLKDVPGGGDEWFTCRLLVKEREVQSYHSKYGVSGETRTWGVGQWFNDTSQGSAFERNGH